MAEDLLGSQKQCDHLQNFRVAPVRIIKAWGIDENHPAAVEIERLRNLYLASAGLEPPPSAQRRVACRIDELSARVALMSL